MFDKFITENLLFSTVLIFTECRAASLPIVGLCIVGSHNRVRQMMLQFSMKELPRQHDGCPKAGPVKCVEMLVTKQYYKGIFSFLN